MSISEMWRPKFQINASVCNIDEISDVFITGHKNFEMTLWNMIWTWHGQTITVFNSINEFHFKKS